MNDFDTRMRRVFAGIDTAPGFESRLAGRIASVRDTPAGAALAGLERRRELARRQLRREFWMNAVTAAGVGAAGIAVVWRHGPNVARWVEESVAIASDPALSMGFALAVLALGLWPALRSLLPR